MTDTYYKIRSGEYEFYGNIEKTEKRWTVSIGGKKSGCVLIHINDRNRRGELDFVGYDQRCTIDGAMPRGAATVAMVRAGIVLAFTRFPSLKLVYLRDHTRYDCDTTDFYLAHLMLGLYGKTWYEKNMNAELENKDTQAQVDLFIQEVQQPLPDFNDFWKLVQGSIPNDEIADIKRKLKVLWQKHTSMRSLLQYLRNHDKCILFMDWLPTYFTSMSRGVILENSLYMIRRENTPWKVDVEVMEKSPYHQEITERSKQKEEMLRFLDDFKPRLSGAGPLYGTVPRKRGIGMRR
jgi:hypothetical protein